MPRKDTESGKSRDESKVTKKSAKVTVNTPVVPAIPPKHVYRWDLDKTYLKSEFETVRDLFRAAFEGAEKKQAVPGAAALLREIRKRDGARVCFISGSPRQMRKVLTKKLQLDGVEFDEFILKPNLGNLFRGRFRAMREQVGYKLPALLAGRSGLPDETKETCFGDDAEADAFVYSLYADLLSGRVDRALLEKVLAAARVYPDDAKRTLSLADSVALARAQPEPVERIFIRLDKHSPTARFDRYGARLCPVYNYFQAAMVLLEDGLVDENAVIRVALEMVDRFDYTLDALRNSLQDLLRRGRLRMETTHRLAARLDEGIEPLGSLPPSRELLARFADRVRALPPPPEGTRPPEKTQRPIDYLRAFAEDASPKRHSAQAS